MKKHRTSGTSAIAQGIAILLALLLTAVPVLAASYDLSTAGSSATINGAIFQQLDPDGSAGTGVFDSFVRIQAEGNDTVERGYNTDGDLEFETKGGAHTHALLLSDVPQGIIGTTVYREFQLDIDEKSSNPLLSLDELQLFTACSPDLTGYKVTPPIGIGTPTVQTTLIYDLDAGEDNYLILNYSLNEGSGKADYLVYIPNLEPHPDCEEETYVYLYSRFGGNYPADDGFEEWGVRKLEVETGELEVIKDVVPDDETTNWVMTVDGPTPFDDVLHGDDTTGPRTVETGAYTIVETAGADTSLDDYTTTYACTIAGDTGPSGTGTEINVTVDEGQAVVCTFTNTKLGEIIVEKQTDPDGATDTFTFTGDAAGSISDGGQIVVSDLLPGTYTSQETAPAGWDLTAIVCDDDNSSGDVGTHTATFNLEAGETVKCTFHNTKFGEIIVEKQTDPDGATDTFTFTGDAAESISDGGQIVVSDLLPGTYTSQETVPAGWDLTAIVCDDDNSSGDVSTHTATFNLEAGETIRCTFQNTMQGSITIRKHTDPAGGAGFQFESDTLGPFNLDDGEEITFSALSAGDDHSVTEVVPEGWELSSIVCSYSSGAIIVDAIRDGGKLIGVTIQLGAGDNVDCTFNNEEEEPTAITLASFTAEPDAEGVTLTWETAAEIDNAGFNVYRAAAPDGPYTKVNSALIAAEGDPVSGASYSFLDQGLSSGTYYYKLEDVDLSGVTTLHGPASAVVMPAFRRPSYRPTSPW